ncbi:MAG: NAD-dependent epimerase/dehydratase family protein [Candidatus Aenigmatarchaeota archaeon]
MRNASVVKGDLRDAGAVSKAVKGVGIVFHEGANVLIPTSVKDPSMDAEVNIRGTLNVLESCRRHDVKRMVFASSSAIYGNPIKLPVAESHAPFPMSPYALSKFCAEGYVRLYHELYGLKTVSLRYFNVYGPGQNADSPYSGVISVFMKNLAEGRLLTVYGDGLQTRDFVNVSDVVCANLLAAESEKSAGMAFNIGTGTSVSVNGLIGVLKSLTKRETEVAYKARREGDVMHSCADIRLARKTLGYEPKVKLEDGLKEMLSLSGVISAPRPSLYPRT